VTLPAFLFTDEKIFTVAVPKNLQNDRQNACTCSNKEERRRDKTPAEKINVQSLTASVGEPQVVDNTPVLVDHEVKINEAY